MYEITSKYPKNLLFFIINSTKKAAVSYFLHKDIFAAKVLNFRVRDGIGCVHLAITAARYAI